MVTNCVIFSQETDALTGAQLESHEARKTSSGAVVRVAEAGSSKPAKKPTGRATRTKTKLVFTPPKFQCQNIRNSEGEGTSGAGQAESDPCPPSPRSLVKAVIIFLTFDMKLFHLQNDTSKRRSMTVASLESSHFKKDLLRLKFSDKGVRGRGGTRGGKRGGGRGTQVRAATFFFGQHLKVIFHSCRATSMRNYHCSALMVSSTEYPRIQHVGVEPLVVDVGVEPLVVDVGVEPLVVDVDVDPFVGWDVEPK